MTKTSLKTWKTANKTTVVKGKSKTVQLKQDRNLFARLLIVTKSRSEINLREALGLYEFSSTPRCLFSGDGTILICQDKSKLANILEQYPNHHTADGEENATTTPVQETEQLAVIVDGMALVHKLASAQFETCEEFADKFVQALRVRSRNAVALHLIFSLETLNM